MISWLTRPIRRHYWHRVISVLLESRKSGLINSQQMHHLAAHFDVSQEGWMKRLPQETYVASGEDAA